MLLHEIFDDEDDEPGERQPLPPGSMPLKQFVKQNPQMSGSLLMGTHSIGHSAKTNFTNSNEFSAAVMQFVNQYLNIDNGEMYAIPYTADDFGISVYPGYGDPDADDVGNFTLNQ